MTNFISETNNTLMIPENIQIINTKIRLKFNSQFVSVFLSMDKISIRDVDEHQLGW